MANGMIRGAVRVNADLETRAARFAPIHGKIGPAFAMLQLHRPTCGHGFADCLDDSILEFRSKFHVRRDRRSVDSVDFPFFRGVARNRAAMGV
jgi:hypothetical protein